MKQQYQILQCQSCNLRFPLTNNALDSMKCVHCGSRVKVMANYNNFVDKSLTNNNQVPFTKLEVILDNIRSAWNVGSIFRSSDAVGINKIYLCGISPTPDNEKVSKTSLGAEKAIAWEYHKNALELVKKMQDQNKQIWAIERAVNSQDLFDINDVVIKKDIVLVMGHEVGGVDPDILRIADKIVHLPMRGVKNSLNVATAFGVVGYFVKEKFF